MANTSGPFGFRQFGHQDGTAPTMGLQRLFINSSDTSLYFTGDLVVQSSANAGAIGVYPGSTSALIPAGVFNGCEFFSPSVGRVVWSSFFPGNLGTSSSPCNAYIQTDQEMTYVCQVSSGALTQNSVGSNINILTATASLGNQTTGISNMTVQSTMVGSGSSMPWRIVDLYSNFAPPGVNGTDNTTNFNDVIVAPNLWQRRAGVTGITS